MTSARSLSAGFLASASVTSTADKVMDLIDFWADPVRCWCVLVPTVDTGSVIWNLISKIMKGSLWSLLSVRENWVKMPIQHWNQSLKTFSFWQSNLEFLAPHGRYSSRFSVVWPDWDWSRGNDDKERVLSQFSLHHICIPELARTDTENLSFLICF